MYAMNEWEIKTSGDLDLNMSTMNICSDKYNLKNFIFGHCYCDCHCGPDQQDSELLFLPVEHSDCDNVEHSCGEEYGTLDCAPCTQWDPKENMEVVLVQDVEEGETCGG